jgi:ankyrin repeat protein
VLFAFEDQHWDAAKTLIESGASLLSIYNSDYGSAAAQSETLLTRILKQDVSWRFTAVKVLLDSEGSIHSSDGKGNKPLNAFAMNPNALPLEYDDLLGKGADANCLDSDGIAPLQRVIMTGSRPRLLPKIVKTLLERGADPLLKNSHYVNALDRARALLERYYDGKTHFNHNTADLRHVIEILYSAKKPENQMQDARVKIKPDLIIESGIKP